MDKFKAVLFVGMFDKLEFYRMRLSFVLCHLLLRCLSFFRYISWCTDFLKYPCLTGLSQKFIGSRYHPTSTYFVA